MSDVKTIRKSGGVIIRDKRLLVTRSYDKDFFIAPGGKLERDETAIEALQRELMEEISIGINTRTLEYLGVFEAEATGQSGVRLIMDVYIVNDFDGELVPSSEVEEIRWINTQSNNITIGSIFKHEIMPILKKRNLID